MRHVNLLDIERNQKIPSFPMSQSQVILYGLQFSRSSRIVWLLELLKVNYELKMYARTPAFRAPPELKKIHPLGKSPVVEILHANGERLVLSETGCIIEYLIEHYDTTGLLSPTTPEGKRLVSFFLHFTEGTLQPAMTGSLVNITARKGSPFFVRPLVGFITGQINSLYYGSELLLNLKYLESLAKENNGGYFVDNKLTAADVVLSFPIVEVIFADKAREVSEVLPDDPSKLFPNLKKWVDLMKTQPSFSEVDQIINAKL